MNVPMWNSGPEFRNTYAVVDARPRRHQQPLRDQRARRQHRRVGTAVERGGVDRAAAARRRRASASGSAASRPATNASYDSYSPVSWPIQRARRGRARVAAGAHRRRRPPPPATRRRAGARSSITNASSSGCWRQFAGQNIAPILQHASSSSCEAERVLAEPQHAVAGVRRRRARSAFATRLTRVVGRAPRELHVAVGERERVGPGARVRAQHVGAACARRPVVIGLGTRRKHGTDVPSRTSYQSSVTGRPIRTASGSQSTTLPTSRQPLVSGQLDDRGDERQRVGDLRDHRVADHGERVDRRRGRRARSTRPPARGTSSRTASAGTGTCRTSCSAARRAGARRRRARTARSTGSA